MENFGDEMKTFARKDAGRYRGQARLLVQFSLILAIAFLVWLDRALD